MKVAAKGISKINDTSSSTSTSSTKSNPKNISLNLNNNPNNLINPNINIKLNLNLSPILFSPSCLNSSIFSPGLDLFKTQSEGYFENGIKKLKQEGAVIDNSNSIISFKPHPLYPNINNNNNNNINNNNPLLDIDFDQFIDLNQIDPPNSASSSDSDSDFDLNFNLAEPVPDFGSGYKQEKQEIFDYPSPADSVPSNSSGGGGLDFPDSPFSCGSPSDSLDNFPLTLASDPSLSNYHHHNQVSAPQLVPICNNNNNSKKRKLDPAEPKENLPSKSLKSSSKSKPSLLKSAIANQSSLQQEEEFAFDFGLDLASEEELTPANYNKENQEHLAFEEDNNEEDCELEEEEEEIEEYDDDEDEEEEEKTGGKRGKAKQNQSEIGGGKGWAAPKRPRPGLSLTIEEIEMVLNCYDYLLKIHKSKKKCCQEVGVALKIGNRKVFEVVQEREALIKEGAPIDCVPLARGEKKRGKPRERIFEDSHLSIIRDLLSNQYSKSGSAARTFPKASEIHNYLKNLPAKGKLLPNSTIISPGPLEVNMKTLKGHLTRLRKEITEQTS